MRKARPLYADEDLGLDLDNTISDAQIASFEESIFLEETRGKQSPYITCLSREKEIKLTPEEAVRQLYIRVLHFDYGYLINKSSKGEKGQYFTPRYAIDMCVKMLDSKETETLIDTAAGSCGFPVHRIFHVWQKILAAAGLPKSHLFCLPHHFERTIGEKTDFIPTIRTELTFMARAASTWMMS